MEHLLNEWCIHFIDIRKNVELAHPRDVYWNMKAIYEKTRECIIAFFFYLTDNKLK